MKFTVSTPFSSLLLFSVVFWSNAAQAQRSHEHHHHQRPEPPAEGLAAAADVPSIKVIMPEAGDLVGSQLAVVFETAANLSAMTMSAPTIGVHLHIGYDDVSLMPTLQQLIGLGKNRYLYLFDLPVMPGAKTLRVYWSDAQHRTIESTMQAVPVMVVSESPK